MTARVPVQLAAVAVTYRRPAVLMETLQRHLDQTVRPTTVVVVDNDPDGSAEDAIARLDDRSVEYVAAGDNLGPAGGFRLGCDRLLDRSFDGWILLIDDGDPPPSTHTLEGLVDLIRRHPRSSLVAGVGLVGAHYRRSTGTVRRLADEELRGIVDVDSIGGGHCPIYRAAALRAVGGFDPALFFGAEELDLGLRVRRAGWLLSVDGDRWLERRRAAGRAGGRAPAGPRQPPWRRYYTVRNELAIARRQGWWTAPLLASVRPLAGVVSSALRRGAVDRGWTIATVRGVGDAWVGRTGRTVLPSDHDR